MKQILTACAALVAAIVLAVSPAAAQQGGMMTSVAYHPVPTSGTVAVHMLDDSDDNMALKDEFEQELTARGYRISDNAALVLVFETRDQIGAWSTTGRRNLITLESGRHLSTLPESGSSARDDTKAKVNVFDSNRGGLFNKGHSGTSITTPSSFRIDVSVEERASGKRLWQGWTEGSLRHADSLALTRKMVPPLVKGIGKTVTNQEISLY